MSNGDYKVSVYSSKLGIPLNFVVHTHVVTECNGVTNRYDVFAPFTMPSVPKYHGHIVKNFLPPTLGFLVWYRKKCWWSADATARRWKTQLVGSVTGAEHSPAHALFTLIENDGLKDYPYYDTYRLVRGPNSNTFTQWIIDQAPSCDISLPWNAWGKGYKTH